MTKRERNDSAKTRMNRIEEIRLRVHPPTCNKGHDMTRNRARNDMKMVMRRRNDSILMA
jgi:hypothetical protein